VLKQVTVDVANKQVLSRVDLIEAVEFPRYDLRLTGQKARFAYATEKVYGEDAAIVRVDLQTKKLNRGFAGKRRTLGEPVFVPKTSTINEERGWILSQGYDSDKNETFLEIRDAQTLEFQSRIWANGQHFPIGFHGNFYQSI
jgi:carotenoid cleavage dioxygenase-like enzyme